MNGFITKQINANSTLCLLMKNYHRIMLGRKSIYAAECLNVGFIGADFGLQMDLSNDLYENWKDFNHKFIPYYLQEHPEKTKVAAGLACGSLWSISKGIRKGDIILSPNGSGTYLVGEVISDYYYQPGTLLPHRRKVTWFPNTIERSDMSEGLQNSTGSIGTVSHISKHAEEIERLIGGQPLQVFTVNDEAVEDPTVFALEKHLEDFLFHNWKQTDIGKLYDIYSVDGELVGRQFPSDTGPIDILAISKDKKELLVVELKRGRASDQVVGQIQRYMGYVLQELTDPDQTVKGVIIALEDDIRIKRALAVTSNISFYRYEVSFRLFKNL